MQSRVTSKRLELLSWLAGVVSVVVAAVSATSAFDFGKRLAGSEKNANAVAALQTSAEQNKADLAQLKNEMSTLKGLITTDPTVSDPTKQARLLQELVKSVRDIEAKQARIEQAIVSNPTRALELPLLQRDVEALKVAQQTAAATMKDSIDRIYDLNKWLLGGMAISIITLAASNLLKSRASRSQE